MEDTKEGLRIRLKRTADGFIVVDIYENPSEEPLSPSLSIQASPPSKRPRPGSEIPEDAGQTVLPEIPASADISVAPQIPHKPILLNASTDSVSVDNALLDQTTGMPYAGPVLVKVRHEAANYPVILPSYSSWFDVEKIHETEIRALPEFFSQEKPQDAEKYKVIRLNF